MIPFKKELFTSLKFFWIPRESIYKHLHFQNVFKVKIDALHSFYLRHYGFQIENEIFWEGVAGWEPASIALWIKLCAQATIVFDVGANTGLYALIAKAMNSQAGVCAFEPVSRVYEKLEENNSLNKYDIICIQKAASNTDGPAIIYDTRTDHVQSVTVGKNMNPPDTEVIPTAIETTRLDTVIEQLGIEQVDLMKLDVETHEVEVLEGLGVYLDLYRPTMLIEILNDQVGQKVENLVTGKGYLYFNIDEVSGSVRRVEHITKSDYWNYLLCNKDTAQQLGLG